MAPSVTDEKILEDLFAAVAQIFEEAQNSLANHKKNCVALFKVHTKSAAITQPAKSGSKKKFAGEKAFQEVFMDMLGRVLQMKKGPANVDRIIKYTGSFVKFMNEKAIEMKANDASISAREIEEDDEDTSTTRFVARLLNWLLQGLGAKNKVVRHRSIQTISEMISHLGEIDEDTYNELRDALIERLNDKETVIRAYAVVALSKLIGSEDPEEAEEGEPTILQMLLDVASSDTAAEVRRAALVNVPISPATLDSILSRTRDVDAVTRRLVYSGVLQPKLGDPRHLSIAQREQIVKDGLGDREPAVRVAAGKLVASWFDAVLVEAQTAEGLGDWEGDDGGVMKGLVHFLGLFDVVGPGEAVAVDAVLSILTIRPDILDVFMFPDAFWTDLSPESIVLARVFVEHCVGTKREEKMESANLPVVTAFAFHIQASYNNLLETLQELETAKIMQAGVEVPEADEELEEELAKREVIMNELLRITLNLDYGDEIGRRKVFSVVKDMLAHPELPPVLIDRCLDVLKAIMPSERDLIRVIVEIVVELREGEEDAQDVVDDLLEDDMSDGDMSQVTTKKDRSSRKKNREEFSPAEKARADATDIRCLMLCIAMLERVNGTFEDNSTLEGILSDLIIPSVKRKELVMREKALVSLGLCCLIAKNMALSSFQLFLSQAQNAPGDLKVQVLRIIMDLLHMYDQEFFGRTEENATKIVDFLLQILDSEDSAEAQTIIATGLCKLLLAGKITQTKVLSTLALMYISPNTVDNQPLRQCIAYFFPVYACSSSANQLRVQSVFIPTFDTAVRIHEELEEDQEMISPYQFGLLMVDWTNPQKAAEMGVVDKIEDPHAQLAIDILFALYDSERSADEQKSLCQLLAQLIFEHGLDEKSIRKINILLEHHEEQCPFDNIPIEKLFNKFKNNFSKLYAQEIKDIDPKQYISEEFIDLYQRIGVDAPEEGVDRVPRGARGKAKRTSRRAAEEEEEEEADEDEDEDMEEEVGEDAEEQEEKEDEVEQENEKEDQDKDAEVEEEEDHAEIASTVDSEAEADHDDDAAENISRASTATPPPTRKSAARKPASKATGSKSRRSTDQVESIASETSERSDEENVPPDVEATPKKKKGTKRAPVSAPNSPAVRKRTRVKAPLKLKEITPVVSEDEGDMSPTPKKPTRQTRGRKAATTLTAKAPAAGRKKKAVKAPTPPSDDEEAADAASPQGTPERAVSAAASSDDFGGYSD